MIRSRVRISSSSLSTITSTTFSANGKTYTLQLTGFTNVVGDGFLQSNSNEFHVEEGQTASADLTGKITTNLTAAPEPSTIVSACMAGLIGLGYAWRRRKAKAA